MTILLSTLYAFWRLIDDVLTLVEYDYLCYFGFFVEFVPFIFFINYQNYKSTVTITTFQEKRN